MAEVWAYADESGISNTPFCVVAGYLASLHQGKQFSKDWSTVLRDYSVGEFKSSEFFHVSSHQSSRSPYRGWTAEKRRIYLDELLDSALRRQIIAIGSAIDVQDFMSFSELERRIFTGSAPLIRSGGGIAPALLWPMKGAPTQPYMVGFTHFVAQALMKSANGTRINFVFDIQNVLQSGAQATYKEFLSRKIMSGAGEDRLGSLDFRDSKLEPPLQLADRIAHLWYNFGFRQNAGGISGDREYALNRLTIKGRQLTVYNKAHFEAILEMGKRDVESRLLQRWAANQPDS